jgi:hypothetical protein
MLFFSCIESISFLLADFMQIISWFPIYFLPQSIFLFLSIYSFAFSSEEAFLIPLILLFISLFRLFLMPIIRIIVTRLNFSSIMSILMVQLASFLFWPTYFLSVAFSSSFYWLTLFTLPISIVKVLHIFLLLNHW